MGELYSACVANYMSVTGKDLMLLFMNTPVAYKYMKNCILKKANNNPSEDVVQAAYQDFIDYYIARSLRSYQEETGNSLAALAFTFNSFYLKSSMDKDKEDANFFTILNTVGVMAENDDGMRPHLDTAKVEQKAVGKGLNFPDAVEKIYNASALLYQINARAGSFIYYDLFSRYRELLNHEEIKELRSEIFNACDFWNFELEDSVEYRESKDSIYQYSLDRKMVSEKLFELVRGEVPNHQMFDYYKDLVNTDLTIGKNGSKGFANLTFSKTSTARLGIEYDAQVRVAIEGAMALKQLVQYAGEQGINLNKIDYAIFRDKRLHNKCRTLEEYVKLQKDLKDLVKSIPENGEKGLLSNDAVVAHLQNKKVVQSAIETKPEVEVDYDARVQALQKLKCWKLGELKTAQEALSVLGKSMQGLAGECEGYEYLCHFVNYVNANLEVAKMFGCGFYNADTDRMSDMRIVEYVTAALSKLEGLEKFGAADADMYKRLCEKFGVRDERILLATGALAEAFLGRILKYVAEYERAFGPYITSLLDRKYELWMNVSLDTFPGLYEELLDCSRHYDCNYSLDREIEYNDELKCVFAEVMEYCGLISKSTTYAQRKLVAVPPPELIKANQEILVMCNTGLTKPLKTTLKTLFNFNAVNFAYQNGVLLEYRQCYIHKNGYLYNKNSRKYQAITLDDLALLKKLVK